MPNRLLASSTSNHIINSPFGCYKFSLLLGWIIVNNKIEINFKKIKLTHCILICTLLLINLITGSNMRDLIEKPYITGHEFFVLCVDAKIKKRDIVNNCNRSMPALNNWIKGGVVTTETIDQFILAYNKLKEDK